MRVFLTSPWIPAEWIRAHQLDTRSLWMANDVPPEAPLAAGVCAFAERAVCLAKTQPDDAVVFSTSCDQLRRAFDAATLHGQTPHPGPLPRGESPNQSGTRAFLFNLPATHTAVAREIYRAEVERLGRFLVEWGGTPPTAERLWREMGEADAARRRLREAAGKTSARAWAEAVARFHEDGIYQESSGRAHTRVCRCGRLSSRPDNAGVESPAHSQAGKPALPSVPGRAVHPSKKGVPLALVGGPLPEADWGLFDVIESAGGCVTLNGTENGERSLCPQFDMPGRDSPPTEIGNIEHRMKGGTASANQEKAANLNIQHPGKGSTTASLLEALVEGYWENITDVFERPNTRLYAWLKQQLAARPVRGMVLWHFTGCDLWRAEAQRLREVFSLPVLMLEAGAEMGISPREVNRLQAFVETLTGRQACRPPRQAGMPDATAK